MTKPFSKTVDWSRAHQAMTEAMAVEDVRERLEAAAQSGEAIAIVINLGDGDVYDALVTVTKDGDTFTCKPAAPLTKRHPKEPR